MAGKDSFRNLLCRLFDHKYGGTHCPRCGAKVYWDHRFMGGRFYPNRCEVPGCGKPVEHTIHAK